MPIKLANNASGTLATAISASDTGIVLTTGDGAEFPVLSTGDYFYATITSSQGTQEIVKATARSGDSLTVVRAQEGTTAAGFAAGARFELRVTAQSVFDAVDDVVASQVGFTPTGGIAATDVQAALAEVDTEKVAFTRLDDNDGSSLVGFLQAGTGAAPTTVQAKLRETVSVFDFMTPAQIASVIAGDMNEDVTVPCQTALTAAKSQRQVFFPTGKYKTTAALIAYGGFNGAGSGTIFMPQGTHECFRFLPGTSNESWAITSSMATYVGDFMVQFPGSGDVAGDPSYKGIWINKGIALPGDGSCENVTFKNIYFRNCYNAIFQGVADKGNLWNVAFRDIMIVSSKDYGVYLDLTGSNGSLNVSFDNITIDYGTAPSYGKGAYLNAIANLTFKGISTSRLTSDAAVLSVANCTNADITVQQENNLMTVPDQRPTMILNCTSMEMALVVNTPIVNPGAGNNVNYIYVDDQTRAFILRQFQTLGETITSGTRKVLNAAFATGSSTKFTILDGTVTASDVVMSAGQLAATYFPGTNYALQNTPIAQRRAAQGISVSGGVTKAIQSVADYAGKAGAVAGLYVVQGTRDSDYAIGFTDLVLVTGVGQSTLQSAVAVSSNSIGAADARTYSISGNNLQVTIPSNNYTVGITGFDLAGAFT